MSILETQQVKHLNNMRKLNKIGFVISSLCVLLVVSCKPSQDYTIEDMDLPEEYELPDSVQQDLDDAIIPWQEFFEDTVLVKLINNAFEQNFDIRRANKEIAINEQLFKESKVAFLPSVNLNLLNIERTWKSQYSRSSPEDDLYDHKGKSPPTNMFVQKSSFQSSVALDWEVDLWGKFRKKRKQAQALYQQSYEIRKALQTEIVATVAEDYYNLIMLDEQIDVAKQNRKLRDSTHEMIKLQYDAGEVNASGVQQSKLQVLEAEALVPELEEERTFLENKLRLLTGKLPDHIDRDQTLSAISTTYEEVDSLPLYLVRNRPDVVVSRYQLRAANAELGVRQVERYPSLAISAEGGVESVLGKNWFNIPGSLLGGLIGNLTAPIFNNRELKTNFEVAKLERDEAEIDFQNEVYEAVMDVQNSLTSVDKLGDQLEIITEQQKESIKNVNSSRRLFRSGYADYLEVIRAQEEAFNNEIDLVQIKTNLLTARIELYRALGGGWEMDEDDDDSAE